MATLIETVVANFDHFLLKRPTHSYDKKYFSVLKKNVQDETYLLINL